MGTGRRSLWQEHGPGLPVAHLRICPQRVHLDIQVGEHANDYAEIAAKDKLSELQLRVRQLVEQVEQIQKEQNYQRVSEWAQGSPPAQLRVSHAGVGSSGDTPGPCPHRTAGLQGAGSVTGSPYARRP